MRHIQCNGCGPLLSRRKRPGWPDYWISARMEWGNKSPGTGKVGQGFKYRYFKGVEIARIADCRKFFGIGALQPYAVCLAICPDSGNSGLGPSWL